MLLHISYPGSDEGNCRELSSGFSKHTTIEELKVVCQYISCVLSVTQGKEKKFGLTARYIIWWKFCGLTNFIAFFSSNHTVVYYVNILWRDKQLRSQIVVPLSLWSSACLMGREHCIEVTQGMLLKSCEHSRKRISLCNEWKR